MKKILMLSMLLTMSTAIHSEMRFGLGSLLANGNSYLQGGLYSDNIDAGALFTANSDDTDYKNSLNSFGFYGHVKTTPYENVSGILGGSLIFTSGKSSGFSYDAQNYGLYAGLQTKISAITLTSGIYPFSFQTIDIGQEKVVTTEFFSRVFLSVAYTF